MSYKAWTQSWPRPTSLQAGWARRCIHNCVSWDDLASLVYLVLFLTFSYTTQCNWIYWWFLHVWCAVLLLCNVSWFWKPFFAVIVRYFGVVWFFSHVSPISTDSIHTPELLCISKSTTKHQQKLNPPLIYLRLPEVHVYSLTVVGVGGRCPDECFFSCNPLMHAVLTSYQLMVSQPSSNWLVVWEDLVNPATSCT